MNGRALLLLLLCLGFVGIWNQDSAWQSGAKPQVTESSACQCDELARSDSSGQPPATRQWLAGGHRSDRWRRFGAALSAVSRQLKHQRIQAPAGARSSLAVRSVAFAEPHGASPEGVSMTELVSDEVCLSATDLRLPEGIAPGRYQVVNNRGTVLNMLISDCDLAYRGVTAELPARELYVMQEDHQRWFFIRQLDDQSVLVQTQEPVASQSGDVAAAESDVEVASELDEIDWQSVGEHVVRAGRTSLEQRLASWERTGRRISRVRRETAAWLSQLRQHGEQLAADLGRWVESAEAPMTVTEGVKSEQTL